MKMFGSNFWDTMIGTTGIDTIHARGGDDLLATNGGRDSIYGEGGNDLISGFSFNLDKLSSSASRGALLDGGAGSDTVILDIDPAKKVSVLAKAEAAMTIHHVEDTIFNVASITTKQVIVGTRDHETICASGDASVRGMEGNDYIFTTQGDDNLNGGDGNDFLSAGLGHNTLAGGKGSDVFEFRLEVGNGYQYSNITDFQRGSDKIAIIIDVDQQNLLYHQSGTPRESDHAYGDPFQGVGGQINDYVSYSNGRFFDSNDFHQNEKAFNDFVTYEQSTGSVLINRYVQIDSETLGLGRVLVAHIDGNPALHADDFSFLTM